MLTAIRVYIRKMTTELRSILSAADAAAMARHSATIDVRDLIVGIAEAWDEPAMTLRRTVKLSDEARRIVEAGLPIASALGAVEYRIEHLLVSLASRRLEAQTTG